MRIADGEGGVIVYFVMRTRNWPLVMFFAAASVVSVSAQFSRPIELLSNDAPRPMGVAFSSSSHEIQTFETKSRTLWVRCTIDPTGSVRNVDVIRSSGSKQRDEKCLTALKAMKLEPAMTDGKPREQRVLLELQSSD